MNDGDFTHYKPGYYTVQNAEENDFINNNLDSDQYGIYYSVKFTGDAETYLWQAKTAPVGGQKYYGHIEPTKNGKSLRFKKDKVPEGQPAPSSSTPAYSESPEKQTSIYRSVALNDAAVVYQGTAESGETIVALAEFFNAWLNNETPAEAEAKQPARDWNKVGKASEPMPEYPGDEEE